MAERNLQHFLNRAHLEEILNFEFRVSTLQSQIRQLQQWVGKGNAREGIGSERGIRKAERTGVGKY